MWVCIGGYIGLREVVCFFLERRWNLFLGDFSCLKFDGVFMFKNIGGVVRF